MLMAGANRLFLGEPTTHLDIPSSEAVERALRRYEGTLCLITHDRHLINTIANKILVIRDGTLEIHPGNFDDYQRIWAPDSGALSSREGQEKRFHGGRVTRRKTQEQRRAEAVWRNRLYRESSPLRERLAQLEGEIDRLTARLDQLTHALTQTETYCDSARIREINKSHGKLKEEIHELTREWESTAEQLDNLERQFEASKPGLPKP
jgi:ATP-binding cassette subfamily F protein 3